MTEVKSRRPTFRSSCLVLAVLFLLTAPSLWADGAPDASVPYPSADLQATFDAIDHPTVSGALAAPELLQVGRAELRPGADARMYVLSAGNKVVGYLLEGKIRLIYRVEDRFSIAPSRHNVKRASGLKMEEKDGVLEVTAELQGAAVWGWDLKVGDLTLGMAGDGVTPVTGKGLPDWLSKVMETKLTPNPARDLLFSKRNGAQPGYRWAVFHGQGEDWVLDVDPRLISRSEYFGEWDKTRRSGSAGPYSGRYRTARLMTQPIGRQWWDSEAVELVSTKVEAKVVNKGKSDVRVETKTELLTQRDGLQLLSLSLPHGAFDHNRDWQDNHLRLLKVDGESVPFLWLDGELILELPEKAPRGHKVVLETVTEGDVLMRPSGDNYWRLGLGSWYPYPSLGGAEWAEFHLDVEVASPYVPFVSGEVLERTSTESSNRVKTFLKGPMQYAVVIAGKYKTLDQDFDGSRLHISSYGQLKKDTAERLGKVMYSIMDCMGVWLGEPYPFQDLQVVEVKQWGWGQAPPGVIFITQEAFLTKAAAQVGEDRTIAALTSKGINERVSHEVAHAWFPHVAKITRGEENWLSESLADYTSAYCLQQQSGNKRKANQSWNRQMAEWKARSEDSGDATSVYLAAHLTGFDQDARIRQGLLYNRGPLVLHSIRQQLQKKHGEAKGDEMFLTWLRSYVKNFTYKVAETRYLIQILNQISGEDWQPFFERYIFGNESPPVD